MYIVGRRAKRRIAWVEEDHIFVVNPFNRTFLEECQQIIGREWDADRRATVFPIDIFERVVELCDKWSIEFVGKSKLSEELPERFAGGHIWNLQIRDNRVAISFSYNPTIVKEIRKEVPLASWNAAKKCYYAPIESLPEAFAFGEKRGFTYARGIDERVKEINANRVKMHKASATIRSNSELKIPGLVGELLPYQKAGVEYLRNVRKAILGDQPGLGKTIQALATVAMEGALPVVVVCPNTLKFNWERECNRFFPSLKVSVMNGTKISPLDKSDVIVINYDILNDRIDDILDHGYKSLIVDEAHAIKNGVRRHVCPICNNSLRSNARNCTKCGTTGVVPSETWSVKRTGAVIRLSKVLDSRALVLLLTGTPVTNRPMELVSQLDCIGKLDQFGGAWKFKNRYAPTPKTVTNTQELNRKLRETCFVRRLKSDVYKELPPLRNAVQHLSVSSGKMSWYKNIENDTIEYFARKAKAIAEESGYDGTKAYIEKRMRLQYVEHLVRVTALRDAASKIKYDPIIDWIDNFLESGDGEKVIIFADHIELVEKIYEKYKSMAVKIRGGVSDAKRKEAVDRFQNDPTCRIFVGNMRAASEGLTLTAASDVVFCELAWTPTIHEQCAGRAYGRANDLHGATAWYLLAPDTIDEDIYKLLDKKKKIVDSITDGIDPDGEAGSVAADLMINLVERGMKFDV
jgi:SNF2 family DNA or RNA helicase